MNEKPQAKVLYAATITEQNGGTYDYFVTDEGVHIGPVNEPDKLAYISHRVIINLYLQKLHAADATPNQTEDKGISPSS